MAIELKKWTFYVFKGVLGTGAHGGKKGTIT
jgi:hypothetical protein